MAVTPDQPAGDPDAIARLLVSRLDNGDISIPVSGSSMKGLIESGAVVTITRSSSPRRGEVWAFTGETGQVLVHRIRHIGKDTVTCRGVGNRADDSPVSRSRLIGRVVSSTTTGTDHSFGTLDRLGGDLVFRLRGLARAIGLRRR